MDNSTTVVIRNGIIGRSTHWGIHSGNGASNVQIEDIVVGYFEVAAIQSGLYLFCVSIE